MNITQKKPEEMIKEKELLEMFKELPKVIQDAVLYSGWEDKIRNLVKSYGLRIDQGNQLENLVFSLMLGQVTSEEILDFLLNDINLPENNAFALFKDIDIQIFDSIYKQVVALNKQKEIQDLELESEPSSSKENEQKKEPDLNKYLDEDEIDFQTYVKEDREVNSMDDEILTVTRDEILKNIEYPETIEQNSKNSDLPKLNEFSVMQKPSSMTPAKQPKPNIPNVSDNSEIPKTFIPSQPNNDQSSQNIPTTELNPLNKINTPKPKIQEQKFPDYAPTGYGKEEEPFVNPEQHTVITEDTAPLDPVDLALQNKISTSNQNKDYGVGDPYREPVE